MHMSEVTQYNDSASDDERQSILSCRSLVVVKKYGSIWSSVSRHGTSSDQATAASRQVPMRTIDR